MYLRSWRRGSVHIPLHRWIFGVLSRIILSIWKAMYGSLNIDMTTFFLCCVCSSMSFDSQVHVFNFLSCILIPFCGGQALMQNTKPCLRHEESPSSFIGRGVARHFRFNKTAVEVLLHRKIRRISRQYMFNRLYPL